MTSTEHQEGAARATNGALARAPQFIVIGAVKAATTWTAKQLNANPALFVPGPEPHFFSTEYDRGLSYYDSLFENAPEGAMIGEKSADYLAHPEAAARIADTLPLAKLIVQLRNPIDRAYSDYCMLYRRGTVTDAPAVYFQDGAGHGERFLSGGLYAEHLSRFFDRFARSQLLALLYEDVKDAPRRTLEAISAHIGVAPHIEDESLATRENDGAKAILPLPLRSALKPLKNAVKPLRGNPAFEGVRGLLARPVAYPPLTADARARLADYYESDIGELGRLIGRDLSHWLTGDAPTSDVRLDKSSNAMQTA